MHRGAWGASARCTTPKPEPATYSHHVVPEPQATALSNAPLLSRVPAAAALLAKARATLINVPAAERRLVRTYRDRRTTEKTAEKLRGTALGRPDVTADIGDDAGPSVCATTPMGAR